MMPKDTPLSEIDQDTRRRRALANVYSLLIRLAEEAEISVLTPKVTNKGEEKIAEPDSINEDLPG